MISILTEYVQVDGVAIGFFFPRGQWFSFVSFCFLLENELHSIAHAGPEPIATSLPRSPNY